MFKIKKLDIFIARQFLLLFTGSFFVSLFVLLMQGVWKFVDVLIGKGLTIDVLAQFFWYLSLQTVPMALPLALLLSSLITFGNLGESSELTAIKSAGISLMQAFRSLIVITVILTVVSFLFQNSIGPRAQKKMMQLLVAMKYKSPELEIPEGIFYSGIPNSNLYVQKKDLNTGKLYGIMIYRMTASYEDQAIILADSGMLQSTAEKKHLVMTLWNGEWFENMQAQELGNNASVPYRRETFVAKKIVFDFDGDLNMTDASAFSNDARGKNLAELRRDADSLTLHYDSVGQSFMADARQVYYKMPKIGKRDSLRAVKLAMTEKYNIDSIFKRLSDEDKRRVTDDALYKVRNESGDLEFKKMVTQEGDWLIRRHKVVGSEKWLLTLSCLMFFFIGAPLGSIIRKGGLGTPIIVSVLVYIVYYTLETSGIKMAREGAWAIWFGTILSPAVLIPLAIFITYKANNDSAVLNIDLWKDMFRRMLGLRLKRHIAGKEVIINEPDYGMECERLCTINEDITRYSREHSLKSAPNIVKVFFKYKPDHEIERISEELEASIENLSNTRDNAILKELNGYPILAVKAHTRPFEKRWLNIMAGLFVPAGLFFYIRMWGFRLRLYKDLRVIKQTNTNIISRIGSIYK